MYLSLSLSLYIYVCVYIYIYKYIEREIYIKQHGNIQTVPYRIVSPRAASAMGIHYRGVQWEGGRDGWGQ